MAEHYHPEETRRLTSQETFSLIFEQSKFLSIGYPAKTVDRIWELTTGHPYYVQLIYEETLDYALGEGISEIDPATFEQLLPFILERSAPQFEKLTANLAQPALDVLAASAVAFKAQQPITSASVSSVLDQNQRPVDAKELADAILELQSRNILRRDEAGVFSFTMPLLAYWLLQQYPLKASDLIISSGSRFQPPQPKWLVIGGSGVMIVLLLFIGWRSVDEGWTTAAASATEVGLVAAVTTATPRPSPSPTPASSIFATATATKAPTPIVEATAEPLPTDTPLPTSTPTEPTLAPTFTLTPLPTDTPLPPTSSPSPTPSSLPPTLPPLPTASPTVAIPATPTPNLPDGSFALLNPVALDQPSYGLTEFEWQWTGPVPADTGFEVRVWREGEPQAGVHDAVADNQNGKIENLGQNKYRLRVDITDAAGVQGQRGEYWWTVALVQVSPNYTDLGQQASPALMRFEPKTGGGGGGSGGEGGGGGVGVD